MTRPWVFCCFVASCAAPAPPTPTPTPRPTPTPTPIPTPSPTPTPTPSPSPTPPRRNPIHARLETVYGDLPRAKTAESEVVASQACNEILVAVARSPRGVTVGDVQLAEGDVLVATGLEETPMRAPKGSGTSTVVVAEVQPPSCEPGGVQKTKRIVRASAAPELTWAGGAMHAHLDVESDVSPNAYLGRLAGTAPVAEHAHADSWEVICAIDAAGTFRLDGKDGRLGPGACVEMPPGAKHQWTPDAGTRLVAVQLYAPPGPEQRFKALAAQDRTSPASGSGPRPRVAPDAAPKDAGK